MWVVAALSCSIALLIAGVVFVVIAATGSSQAPPTQRGEKTADSSHPSSVAPAPAAVVAPAGGPFTSARTAFNSATSSPQPTSLGTNAPPPVMGAVPSATDVPSPNAPPPALTAPPVAPASAPQA